MDVVEKLPGYIRRDIRSSIDMSIDDMVSAVDIVKYISQYSDLELRGDGEYWGVSCLSGHDTDPSMSVNQEQQIFYDFSSHTGGNIISFIQKHDRCSTAEAIGTLKKYIAANDLLPAPKSIHRLGCTKVIKKFAPPKKQYKEAKYAKLPADHMDMFSFDIDKLSVWVDEGIPPSTLEKWQVRFDGVSNRIVFPIRSVDGDIINVCGRTIDPDYRAKKLRKYTYFFPLGRFDTLFGFAENVEHILEKNEIILFEGPKSVMLADSWGVSNAAALCTSRLNFFQFLILLKIGVRVVFALDTDADISKDENIRRLCRYVRVENVADRDGLLGEKMAPVDAGEAVWEDLYRRRERAR